MALTSLPFLINEGNLLFPNTSSSLTMLQLAIYAITIVDTRTAQYRERHEIRLISGDHDRDSLHVNRAESKHMKFP